MNPQNSRRDRTVLRRIAIPSAILSGLFLLVNTSRLHGGSGGQTAEARAYVLCAFALLFGGIAALAFSSMDAVSARRYRVGVRVTGIATVAASGSVYLFHAATPIPAWLLVVIAVTLTIATWNGDAAPPSHRR